MESVHDMCGEPAEAPDGTPLGCMKSAGHERRNLSHADRAEGYVWRTGETPVPESEARQ